MENWNDYNYCLEAVKRYGYALRHVKEQTNEICLEAVRRNGLTLKYVKEQTPELCLEAVKQNGYALEFVKEQTPEMVHFIIKNRKNIYEDLVKYKHIKVTQEQMDLFYKENPHLLLTI